MLRAKPVAVRSMRLDDQKAHLRGLPPEEQRQLAAECREMVLEGYDEGFGKAKAAGKTVEFSHQVGVLEAAQRVLANHSRQNNEVTRGLQLETVPFNKAEAALGRLAIAEYLVWKFFPDLADLNPLTKVIRVFVNEIYSEHSGSDDGFRYEAIYSNKHDWQKLAVLEAKARVGESNA
jgi:hypothetical protein